MFNRSHYTFIIRSPLGDCDSWFNLPESMTSITQCQVPYKQHHLDWKHYEPGWTNVTEEFPINTTATAWSYQSANALQNTEIEGRYNVNMIFYAVSSTNYLIYLFSVRNVMQNSKSNKLRI